MLRPTVRVVLRERGCASLFDVSRTDGVGGPNRVRCSVCPSGGVGGSDSVSRVDNDDPSEESLLRHEGRQRLGKGPPPRDAGECDDRTPDNVGNFVPTTDDVSKVLEMLDGMCTDRDLEHKTFLDCIASKKTPFVSVSFKLAKESKKEATTCVVWLKSAALKDRRWVVVDALLAREDNTEKPSLRNRYDFELKADGPVLWDKIWDTSQMVQCQAPGAVAGYHKSEHLPNELGNFFLCDNWH